AGRRWVISSRPTTVIWYLQDRDYRAAAGPVFDLNEPGALEGGQGPVKRVAVGQVEAAPRALREGETALPLGPGRFVPDCHATLEGTARKDHGSRNPGQGHLGPEEVPGFAGDVPFGVRQKAGLQVVSVGDEELGQVELWSFTHR